MSRVASPLDGRVRVAIVALLGCLWAPQVHAHPGGLDANGCHHERATGGYHCHGGSSRPSPAPRPRPVVAPPPAAPTPEPAPVPEPVGDAPAPSEPTPTEGARKPAAVLRRLAGRVEGCAFVVGPGDTFNEIAAFLGLEPEVLLAMNPGVTPGWLEIGQRLNVSEVCATPPMVASPGAQRNEAAEGVAGAVCMLTVAGMGVIGLGLVALALSAAAAANPSGTPRPPASAPAVRSDEWETEGPRLAATLLLVIAGADRKVTSDERIAVRKALLELFPENRGLQQTAWPMIESIKASGADIQRLRHAIGRIPEPSRWKLMRAAEAVAVADGKATPKEKERLTELRAALGITRA